MSRGPRELISVKRVSGQGLVICKLDDGKSAMHMPMNDWIKETLAAKKMTQRELAEAIGVDPSTLSLMLQGKRRLTLDKAKGMAQALQVSISDLAKATGFEVENPEALDIVGFIDGTGAVHITRERLGTTPCPYSPCEGHAALTMRTADSGMQMLNGWVAFIGPVQDANDAMLDRTVVAKLEGSPTPVLRLLRRGSFRGVYTLTDALHDPLYDQKVEWVRSLQMMRPA